MTAAFQGRFRPPAREADAAPFEASEARPYFTYAWFAAAVAVGALSVMNSAGSASVLIYLATLGYLLVRAPEKNFLAVMRWLPALAIAILAIASTIWSEDRSQSLRVGISLLATLIGAVILTERLTPLQFVGAAFCGLMVVVVGSLLTDNYMPSLSGYALYGLAGTKNPLGYLAMLAALMSMATAMDRNQPVILRRAAMLGLPASLLTLYLSKSMGAFVTGGAGLLLFVALLVVHSIPPRWRILALIGGLVFLLPVAINWEELKMAAQDFQVHVLNRDHTLSGRTYLWERAQTVIERRPILGHGYDSFWRQGRLDAEGLWRWAGVGSRMGFNFHNEYIDVTVSLGYVGLVIFVATLIGLAAPVFARALFAPSIPIACMAASVAPMYLRTSAESGLLNAWGLMLVVLYAAGVYGIRGDKPRDSGGEETQEIEPEADAGDLAARPTESG